MDSGQLPIRGNDVLCLLNLVDPIIICLLFTPQLMRERETFLGSYKCLSKKRHSVAGGGGVGFAQHSTLRYGTEPRLSPFHTAEWLTVAG